MNVTLRRALVAEFLGTAFLLIAVCGSGTLAHSLDQGNVALSVLCVAITTGTALCALICTFGAISAHFNPLVTVSCAVRREFAWARVLPYVAIQIAGAIFGVIIANLMFNLPPITISETARTGAGQWLGEVVATFGLLGVIIGCGKSKPESWLFCRCPPMWRQPFLFHLIHLLCQSGSDCSSHIYKYTDRYFAG